MTGEKLDRSWRLQAEAGGVMVDVIEVWEKKCYNRPISPAEFLRRRKEPLPAVIDRLRTEPPDFD